MWWYPADKSKVEKYFAPCQLGKMSSTFGIGQINFPADLVGCTDNSMTRHFPPSPFGTTIMGADQLDQLAHITFAVRSLLILSCDPFVMIHHNWIEFLWNWLRISSIYCYLGQWGGFNSGFLLCQTETAILLASPLILFGYFFFNLWCGGLKVSGSTFLAIIPFVVRLWAVSDLRIFRELLQVF